MRGGGAEAEGGVALTRRVQGQKRRERKNRGAGLCAGSDVTEAGGGGQSRERRRRRDGIGSRVWDRIPGPGPVLGPVLGPGPVLVPLRCGPSCAASPGRCRCPTGSPWCWAGGRSPASRTASAPGSRVGARTTGTPRPPHTDPQSPQTHGDPLRIPRALSCGTSGHPQTPPGLSSGAPAEPGPSRSPPEPRSPPRFNLGTPHPPPG